jgi:hypothetical protein
MYEKKNVSIGVLICPVCSKRFIPAPYHIYKARVNGNRVLCCSYTCMRKNETEYEKKLKQSSHRIFGRKEKQ